MMPDIDHLDAISLAPLTFVRVSLFLFLEVFFGWVKEMRTLAVLYTLIFERYSMFFIPSVEFKQSTVHVHSCFLESIP